MKIKVKIHHQSGDIGTYPVHKLVRNNDGWTASYTTVKNGRHEGRKVKLEDGKTELEVNMDQGKTELNPEDLICDRNGIELIPDVAYLGHHKDISIRRLNINCFCGGEAKLFRDFYKDQAAIICDHVLRYATGNLKLKASSLMMKAAYAIRQAERMQEYIKKLEVEK